MKDDQKQEWNKRLEECGKLLIGLGEEWKLKEDTPENRARLLASYDALYGLIKDKDYFIITMSTDALIYETALGSKTERAMCLLKEEPVSSCPVSEEKEITKELMERYFPGAKRPETRADSRWERIVAPCGNVTWRQCSESCTKDIWEQGEIPDGICPHCGAPLTGNTIEAKNYIEEGYLPQWQKYTRWLTETLNETLLILELGVGFQNPGLIRFPFEKTCFFNQKAFLCRVNRHLPQVSAELGARALGIGEASLDWLLELAETTGNCLENH